MELRAHCVVVVAGHCADFARLGGLDKALRRNLLSDPASVSSVPRSVYEDLRFCQFQIRIVSGFISMFHQIWSRMLTVIRTAHDPWQLVVEEDGPDIVQMAVQGEQASSGLVRPDLDLVIITAGDEPAESQYTVLSNPQAPKCAHSGCVLWKSTPRTGPSCSSKRSIRVPIR
jgi:hypothetical protein